MAERDTVEQTTDEVPLISMRLTEWLDRDTECKQLRAALTRLVAAVAGVVNARQIKDRGDLVGAMAQAGRALEGENG